MEITDERDAIMSLSDWKNYIKGINDSAMEESGKGGWMQAKYV